MARRRTAFVLSLVFGVAVGSGCEGPSGPDPELEVSISLTVLPDREAQGIRCSIGVEASAHGDAGARAIWAEAVVEILSPSVPDSVITRAVVPSAEIRDLIGTESIEPGGEVFYTLVASNDLPFSGMLRQRYLPAWTAERQEASAPFTCGPRPGTGPAPTIESLDVVGPMEPGGNGTVRYHATSGVGLWRLDLGLAGSIQATLDFELEGEVDKEEEIVFGLDNAWEVGEAIDITLTATDLLGQSSAETLADIPLVDVTPPSLRLLSHCGAECPTPVGREIHMEVTTSDASAHTVLYSLGDPPLVYDSVARPPGYTNDLVVIPVTEELIGRHTFRVWTRDEFGREGVDTLDNDVLVYPTVSASTVETEVAGTVTDVRIDPARALVYLGRAEADHVLALSAADLSPVATLPVGDGARSMDLTVSGDSLVVVVEDSAALAVVDPDGAWGPELVPLTGLGAGHRPTYVRVAADGRWLVQADYRSSGSNRLEGELVVIDPADGSQTVIQRATGVDGRARLVSSDDRTRIVVGVECTRVYDAGTRSFGPCSSVGTEEVATDAAGGLFVDTWWTLGPTLEVLHADHPIGDRVEAVDLMPDGARLLAVAREGVHVVDVSAWTPVLFFEGTYPTGRFDVSDDGSYGIAWGAYTIGPAVESSAVMKIDLGPISASPAPGIDGP